MALGFTDIYLYDNSDFHDDLQFWADARNDDRIHITHYPGDKIQVPVYKACANEVKHQGHTWVTFLDIDEFLVLKKHDHVIDFASEYVKSGHLGINWQLFGTGGRQIYEPWPVTQRFTCVHSHFRNKYVKSFIRVEDLDPIDSISSPHIFPRREGTFLYDTDGVHFEKSMHQGPRDVALVHHYMFRSSQEHLEKRQRGDVFYGDRGHNEAEFAMHNIDPFTGKPIPRGEIYDDSAWLAVKRLLPSYAVYEERKPHELPTCTYDHENLGQLDFKYEKTAAICSYQDHQFSALATSEWVDYHLSFGFSDIYIFENTDTVTPLQRWGYRLNDERIHVIPLATEHGERTAYKKCSRLALSRNHEWVAYMDIMDFLVLHKHDNVIDFAQEIVPKGHLAIYWNLFGSAGREAYTPWPVTQRFPCRLEDGFSGNKHYRTFLRLQDLSRWDDINSVHALPLREGAGRYDTNGKLVEEPLPDGPRDVAVINRYFYKSSAEFKLQHPESNGQVLSGSVFDDSAWVKLKKMMPRYARYDNKGDSPSCAGLSAQK